jgi:hypothetical protein
VAGAGRPGADIVDYRVPPPAPPPAARQSVEEIIVTSQRRAREVGLDPDAIRLPLQAPLQRLEADACVVYALAGA